MPPVVPALRKRNCIWPLVRTAKGWKTGTLAERYRAALHHLWRTPRGSLPWQPDYGTVIYQFRTQSFNDADTAFLQEDLLRATAQWIPDIVILEIQFVPGELIGEEDERLQIQCAWGIPDATNAGARDTGAPRFAFGPVTQTITV